MNERLPLSSSLKDLRSAMMSSGGAVKPVNEKEKPRLALEALLKAAPLLTSSKSSFSCPLRDFRLWCPTFLPGEVPTVFFPKLDFLDKLGSPLVFEVRIVSAEAVRLIDCDAATFSSWSDFVLPIIDVTESIFQHNGTAVSYLHSTVSQILPHA